MDAFSDIKPVPLDVILSWPKPNFIDPVRRGPALVAINCILLPLALIVVGLRLYTRLIIVHSAGLDDIFIGLASLTPLWIVAVGLTIAVCLAASQYGWDLHIWDVPTVDIIPSRLSTWIAQLLFVAATNLTKLSILLFYRRLSTPGIRKTLDYAVWFMIIVVVLYSISFSIVVITACNPVRGFWDISIPHHCDDQRKFEMAAAIMNIIVDFVVILIPLPTVWSLRLPKRQKWALSGVFMLGFFVILVSTIRAYWVNIVVNVTFDTTWEGFILWIFVAVEVDVALICASAPTLKPLFRRYFHSHNDYSTHRGFRRQSSRHPGSNNLEAGKAVQQPIELVSVEVIEPGEEPQKPLPAIPANNGDSESDESMWVLQQVEGDNKKSIPLDASKRCNIQKCVVSKFSAARKEAWSGV